MDVQQSLWVEIILQQKLHDTDKVPWNMVHLVLWSEYPVNIENIIGLNVFDVDVSLKFIFVVFYFTTTTTTTTFIIIIICISSNRILAIQAHSSCMGDCESIVGQPTLILLVTVHSYIHISP